VHANAADEAATDPVVDQMIRSYSLPHHEDRRRSIERPAVAVQQVEINDETIVHYKDEMTLRNCT
jgi:hypothetical protein